MEETAQKDPIAIIWIVAGLILLSAVLIGIVALVPRLG
jgi:hypothetical protein